MHLLEHFENFIHIALLLCYLYRQPSKLNVLDDLQVKCIFYPEAKHHQFATEAISFCPCFIIPQCKLHASKSSLQIYSLVHQVCDIIWFQHTAATISVGMFHVCMSNTKTCISVLHQRLDYSWRSQVTKLCITHFATL